MGPDGSLVVADRVVATVPLGHRADAPAREEARSEQMSDNVVGTVVVDDPAPEQLADVGRERVDGLLVTVQGERVEAAVREPEVVVERLLQLLGLVLELGGERVVVPDLARQACAAAARVVGVALQLAGRARQLRERPVRELDRIPRVLPALILEPALGVATLVLDVAVTVAIAVFIDPRQRGTSVRLEPPHALAIAGEPLVLVQEDEEQHRPISAAVVRRVRALFERGELAEPQLVQNLPRLLVTEVVATRSLQRRKYVEGVCRELRDDVERLVTRDQAVPAGQGLEPGQPSRRNGTLGPLPRIETQRGEIDEAARVGQLQRLPVRLERRRNAEQLGERRLGAELGSRRDVRSRLVAWAVPGRLMSRRSAVDGRHDFDPGRPAAVWRDFRPERNPVRGDFGVIAMRPNPRFADIAAPLVTKHEHVVVDALKRLPLPLDRRILDLEEIREIGAHSDHDLRANRVRTVIHDGQLFEEAVADDAMTDHGHGGVRIFRAGTRK